MRAATRLLVLSLAALVLLPAASFAGDEVRQILDKFATSRTDISYTGIQSVVALNGEMVGASRHRISRYLSEMERMERLDDRNNVIEVVIDDRKSLFRYVPEKKTVYKDHSNLAGLTPSSMRESMELAKLNYDVTVAGKDSVANRDCVKVFFKPKRNDRPSRLLCLDSVHGLPLRTEIQDSTGRVIAASSFSEIVFAPAFPDRHFMLMVPQKTRVIELQEIPNLTMVSASKILGAQIPLPAYIPGGYALREVSLIGKNAPYKVQLAYGDGLTSLSIFQDLRKDPIQSRGMRKISLSGGNSGYLRQFGQTSLLVFGYRSSTFTIIGEINPQEITKIAESFPRQRD